MVPPAIAANTGHIDPKTWYTQAGFITASGVSYSRIRAAAHDGIDIPTFSIGRRKFITGEAAIAYLAKLAEHSAAKSQSRE
jgi:hypothetical protein